MRDFVVSQTSNENNRLMFLIVQIGCESFRVLEPCANLMLNDNKLVNYMQLKLINNCNFITTPSENRKGPSFC